MFNHGRVGVFPHFLSAQNVVHLFTREVGVGGYLFCDWEFVDAGVAHPFAEPGSRWRWAGWTTRGRTILPSGSKR
jgi:hypothetical protein